MAWEDQILYNTFDPRVIGANLFAWFAENQKDALIWANDGTQLTGAKNILIQDFFQNARTPTRFPVCMLEQIAYASETGEDLATVTIGLRYSIQIVHGKQDWLAANSPKYAMAFESMAKNIPKTSLEENSKIVFDSGILDSIETTFDFLRSNGTQFMQEFTTEIVWKCDFSNYKAEE